MQQIVVDGMGRVYIGQQLTAVNKKHEGLRVQVKNLSDIAAEVEVVGGSGSKRKSLRQKRWKITYDILRVQWRP